MYVAPTVSSDWWVANLELTQPGTTIGWLLCRKIVYVSHSGICNFRINQLLLVVLICRHTMTWDAAGRRIWSLQYDCRDLDELPEEDLKAKDDPAESARRLKARLQVRPFKSQRSSYIFISHTLLLPLINVQGFIHSGNARPYCDPWKMEYRIHRRSPN